MMILSPFLVLAQIARISFNAIGRIAGKRLAVDECVPAAVLPDPRWDELSRGLEAEGFTRIGDVELVSRLKDPKLQRTFARGFVAPTGDARANVYQLLFVNSALNDVRVGSSKVWCDVEANLASGGHLRVTNVPPGPSIFDRMPGREVRWLPGASPAALWKTLREEGGGREGVDGSFSALQRHREEETRATYEVQVERGLLARDGADYLQTGKLARRAILRFHLPLLQRGGWRWGLRMAVAGAVWAGALLALQKGPAPVIERLVVAALAGAATAWWMEGQIWTPVLALVLVAIAINGADDLPLAAALTAGAFYAGRAWHARRAAPVVSRLGG